MQDLSKLKKLLKQISKQFAKKHKEIVDIVLFGSATRAKTTPSDIDICILTIAKNTELAEELEKTISKTIKKEVHVSVLNFKDFLDPKETLWKTVIHEGISLLKEKPLTGMLGFNSSVLFWYKLESLEYVDKVRFSFALRGRKQGKGVIDELRGECLGKGVVLVPVENEDQMREFFKTWQVPFNRRRILVEI